MKNSATYIALLLLVGIACTNSTPKDSQAEEKGTILNEEKQEETSEKPRASPSSIDEKRTSIENALSEMSPVELDTEGLRAQISQKWSKIHYYKKDGKIVRIKTYPHPGISKRTEEFYFENEALISVVIEDNGLDEKGKTESPKDRVYYFEDGVFIQEVNHSKEKEYSIKESDAERLLQEAGEYLDVLREYEAG